MKCCGLWLEGRDVLIFLTPISHFKGFWKIVAVNFIQSKGKTFNFSQLDSECALPQLCCGSRLCFLLPGICRG